MPKQQTKTLEDYNIPIATLQQAFNSLTANNPELDDLKIIFNVGLLDLSLFPGIKMAENSTYMDYLKSWIKGYSDAAAIPPSQHKASPKGSCSDPAIQTIVQIAMDIDVHYANRMAAYHNLFMSAENIQGHLLEEYISKSTRPYGWIWCDGNVLKAIDFCSSDGKRLLQVKNKSNTENSSSNKIRNGTVIQKWYRLGTKSRKGIKLPSYKWDTLNSIINEHVTTGIAPNCNMNEESYQEFLRDITSKNTDIISDK